MPESLELLDSLGSLELLVFLAFLESLAILSFLLQQGEFASEAGHLGFEVFYLVGLCFDDLFLRASSVKACRRHALTYAAFFHELAVALGNEGCQGLIHHVAQTDGGVAHLLVCPLGEVGLIVLQSVVGSAKGEKPLEARVNGPGISRIASLSRTSGLSPVTETMLFEVVLIVLHQFLVAALCNAQQLDFHLKRCLPVRHAFGYVLFDGACGLHHLVNRAVAVLGQEALAERFGELNEDVAFLIEGKLGIDSAFAQHAGRSVVVALQLYFARVGHSGKSLCRKITTFPAYGQALIHFPLSYFKYRACYYL